MDEVFGLQEVREQRMPLFKALVAEFLGLVLLVFFGCGTANACARGVLPNRPLPADFITCVSLAFGLTIACTAQAVGHISGGHINPAVTLGILVSGKLSLLRGVLYMIAQFLGGIVGAALLKAVVPSGGFNDAANYWPENHLGANGLQTGVQAYQGMIVEAMVTFILVLVVYGCCDSRRDDVKGSVPLAIGLTVTLSHLLSIGFTGAGLNPARTLGPAIMTGKYDDLWVYFVGPFLGAAVAGILYTVLFRAKKPVPSEDF